jgi:hypothetical protein
MTVVEGGPEVPEANPVKKEHDLPKDAIVVTRPDGIAVDDPLSPTGRLMAPPRADFQEVYAAGKEIAAKPLSEQYIQGKEALGHFGTYDFQRDKATNTFYDKYIPAAKLCCWRLYGGGRI